MKITLKDGSVFEGTAEEYAELVKLGEGQTESRDEYVPKVGDKVRALADSEFRDVREGEIGTVENVDAGVVGSDKFRIEVKTDKSYCYFRPQDLELVAEEEKPKQGDIVVITGNTNGSRNKVGDIGKVGNCRISGRVRVEVPSRPASEGVAGNYTRFDEMRPATEEEKKQYKQAEKFAKLGRKPGEFKKGDIFKGVGGRISQGLFEVVEIREEGSHPIRFINKDGENDGFTIKAAIELIAPVESRVDRVD